VQPPEIWTGCVECDFITVRQNKANEGEMTVSSEPQVLGFKHHDHDKCIDTVMSAAEARCASENLRLTPVRRAALEILLREHRALGAYEVLDLLRSEGFGSQPPVAYRALDFLVNNGFAHRIERMNAFIACSHPDEEHAPAFLICRKCDTVAEASSPMRTSGLGDAAAEAGFVIERTVVEAEGICPSCVENEPS
jgi:Fur family zinc uptake transcriptional regulator